MVLEELFNCRQVLRDRFLVLTAEVLLGTREPSEQVVEQQGIGSEVVEGTLDLVLSLTCPVEQVLPSCPQDHLPVFDCANRIWMGLAQNISTHLQTVVQQTLLLMKVSVEGLHNDKQHHIIATTVSSRMKDRTYKKIQKQNI